ncbi:MAG: hypothetical protein IIA34_10935, partial [Proteobacteria bacterium]|nr:hypothetical protein [Pseudomonadota bacterium]
MSHLNAALFLAAWILSWAVPSYALDPVGEAFGKSVSEKEYNYHLKTATLFTRGDREEATDESRRQEAWENLIFIHEARELRITVEEQTVKEQIMELLQAKEIPYGGPGYKAWVKAALGEDTETFERRIKELVIINKFHAIQIDPEVTVTEEDMRQKFSNQYNSVESEYISFKTKEEAESFLSTVQADPSLWKPMF